MTSSLKKFIFLSIFLIVLIVGIVFFVKNNQLVNFSYLLGITEIRLSVLLLLSMISGSVLGMLSLFPLILHLKYVNARLNRQIKLKEKEVNNLRVIPVRDTV